MMTCRVSDVPIPHFIVHLVLAAKPSSVTRNFKLHFIAQDGIIPLPPFQVTENGLPTKTGPTINTQRISIYFAQLRHHQKNTDTYISYIVYIILPMMP